MDVIDVYAPMPPEPAPPAAAPAPRRCRIGFMGTGAEYFGIWIVNLLLTIVTIGIYSAWAKVRKMRYFYRNTHLDGSVFDYHGDPVAILKGRILAVLLAILYQLSLKLGIFAIVALVGLIAVLPWLLTQSYRFRLHNSSYRGLRFKFSGPLSQAYLIFGIPMVLLLLPGGIATALGVAGADPKQVDHSHLAVFMAVSGLCYLLLLLSWPYVHFAFKRWQHGHAFYGAARAHFEATAGSFYGPYLAAAGLLLVLMLVAGILTFALTLGTVAKGHPPDPRKIWIAVIVVGVLAYVAAFSIGPMVTAWIQNAVWSNTRVEDMRLHSDVRAGRLVGIMVGNLFMVVLSLGLLIPFAVVRLMKYKLESIEVLDADALKRFVGEGTGARVGTAGEGAVDVMDLDFGL